MTDADRLREAANALDDRPPFLTVHQDRATADLLRTVADEGEVCWCGPEYIERGLSRPGCPAHDVMPASVAAALALADTILGGES